MITPKNAQVAGKKVYVPTRLRRYGSITTLTASTGSVPGDGGAAMMV